MLEPQNKKLLVIATIAELIIVVAVMAWFYFAIKYILI